MRYLAILMPALISVLFAVAPVAAQPISSMQRECTRVGKNYFKEPQARTEMKYNGQRVDGMHALNGRIFLENRLEDFACSFDRSGQRMTEFFADGQLQNAYLPDRRRPRHADDSDYFRVTGVPRNDILNVRSGPSAQSRIVGALANGDRVRNLGCRNKSGSRWCRIQMLDDMRSEGWVNARYLDESSGPSQPDAHINHGGRIQNRCAEAVAREVGVSANDVIVTNSTISEGTGRHIVYVGVPYGQADWICEAERDGSVVNVFYSGE